MKTPLMLAAAIALVGCAGSTQPPVTMKGGDVDLMTIAGKWYGTYTGTQSGRKGTIHFELFKGTREAEGQVIMNADKPELAKSLKIKFVSVGGTKITGKIGPYEDPSCKCQVETTFHGTVRKAKIDGAFVTAVLGANRKQDGSWQVVRKAD